MSGGPSGSCRRRWRHAATCLSKDSDSTVSFLTQHREDSVDLLDRVHLESAELHTERLKSVGKHKSPFSEAPTLQAVPGLVDGSFRPPGYRSRKCCFGTTRPFGQPFLIAPFLRPAGRRPVPARRRTTRAC